MKRDLKSASVLSKISLEDKVSDLVSHLKSICVNSEPKGLMKTKQNNIQVKPKRPSSNLRCRTDFLLEQTKKMIDRKLSEDCAQ